MTEYREIYQQALDRFGIYPQIDMCIEEMAELTKALVKYRRDPKEHHRCMIAEETADVQHTLNQIKIAFSSPQEQENWMNAKIIKLGMKLKRK